MSGSACLVHWGHYAPISQSLTEGSIVQWLIKKPPEQTTSVTTLVVLTHTFRVHEPPYLFIMGKKVGDHMIVSFYRQMFWCVVLWANWPHHNCYHTFVTVRSRFKLILSSRFINEKEGAPHLHCQVFFVFSGPEFRNCQKSPTTPLT